MDAVQDLDDPLAGPEDRDQVRSVLEDFRYLRQPPRARNAGHCYGTRDPIHAHGPYALGFFEPLTGDSHTVA